MPFFKYKTLNQQGESIEEKTEAESGEVLKESLVEKGQQVVYIEEVTKRSLISKFLKYQSNLFSSIKEQEKIILARNLGSMIKAGLPLSRALSVVKRQSQNKKLKEVISSVIESIGKGKSFSESLSAHPKVFSKLFISMVAAGEESGSLPDALKNISDQMEKTNDIRKKVKGAMIYPAVIISIMVIIGILMLIYVVPTLTETFEDLEVELPFSTRIVIGISDFVRDQALISLGIVVLLVAGLTLFFRSKTGKRTIDFVLLHFPIISKITKGVNSARTSRTLASLLGAGVEYVSAIEITKDVVQNSYYKKVLATAAESVEKGEPISKVFLKNENLYPVFVGEMASVGEETGNISEMFSGVADFYEDEVAQKIKDISTLIEPLLMVVIGAGVGFFAIAMLTPTYSLVDAI